jgi:hypothetical protein
VPLDINGIPMVADHVRMTLNMAVRKPFLNAPFAESMTMATMAAQVIRTAKATVST